MTMFHVIAAAGDFADDLRSLGLYQAASAREALELCLGQLDEDPVADHDAALRDQEVAELLCREQRQLRDALAEPDVSFIVTPVEAESHFVRDHDGVVKDAGQVERRRAQMRRDFGVAWGAFTRALGRRAAGQAASGRLLTDHLQAPASPVEKGSSGKQPADPAHE